MVYAAGSTLAMGVGDVCAWEVGMCVRGRWGCVCVGGGDVWAGCGGELNILGKKKLLHSHSIHMCMWEGVCKQLYNPLYAHIGSKDRITATSKVGKGEGIILWSLNAR